MSWIIPAVSATLLGTFLLSLVYWYIYKEYRERFLYVWSLSWTFYTVRYIFELFLQYKVESTLVVFGHQFTALISGVLLLVGTNLFMGKRITKWPYVPLILGTVWIIFAMITDLSWPLLNIPTFAFLAFVNTWIGLVYLKSTKLTGFGKQLTGWGFIFWGLHKVNYPFSGAVAWFIPWGYFIAAFLEVVVAAGSLLLYFEMTRKRLAKSEQRFRLMTENARDIIYRYRIKPENGFEYLSPSVASITGYTPGELYVDSDIAFGMRRYEFHEIMKDPQRFASTTNMPFMVRMARKDGREIWTEHRCVPLYNDQGEIVGCEGIARDITERKQAEEVMERYQLLSEQARDIILFFNREGGIIDANEAAVRTYGYSREELLCLNVSDLRAPEAKGMLAEQIKTAETDGVPYETIHQRKDCTMFPIEVNVQSTNLAGERVLFAIVRDITERKRAEDTINHLAFHDPLTDLPNRTLFFDRLGVALSRATRNQQMLAVMFMDLDRFKYVNDLMGHAVGDKLLRNVARKLKRCVRSNDTIARMGGDEFTILLPEIKREQDAAKVAKKILEALRKPWVVNGYEFQITTSIGIAMYPNDGQDKETLTKNADTAMYRAKEFGDNYQFYTPAMNAKAVERLETEQALRRALEREEFEVYYQPQVDINSGRMIGVEALLRWHHPERGIVCPPDFIPPAEDIGLIVPIGEWVLHTACRQAKAWQDNGWPPLSMAVNLSPYQFRQKQLVETIEQVLIESGLDPHWLELEITESTAMHDVDFTIPTMRRLRAMGIRIAIDDFGTGYSSLSYLRRFPITTLKVDRSFVNDVLSDAEDAAIVDTIIVLAHNLNLKVIVEGVETKEQMDFFEKHSCFEMQGHLFSRPVPARQLEELMDKSFGKTRKHLTTVQA